MYSVSYFCAVGNPAKDNQDRVLVYGDLLRDGISHKTGNDELFCCVADGVGSMEHSGNAAEFVLSALRSLTETNPTPGREELGNELSTINSRLVELNRQPGELEDSATTLCGIISGKEGFRTFNIGDSEVLAIVHDELIRLTIPQVLDPDMPGSPITSYLGGREAHMNPEWGHSDDRMLCADTIIVTTDGLLKAIDPERLVQLLSSTENLAVRVENLYQLITSAPAPDNLGAIFIEMESGEPT